MVLSGRLSLRSHPWLADHEVAGVVVFPGAGFVELALRAAEEVGAGSVAELTVSAPLVIPAQGAVAVQVVVGEVDSSGQRVVSIYSRPHGSGGRAAGLDVAWVLHARGVLAVAVVGASAALAVWPPVGAVAVDMVMLTRGWPSVGMTSVRVSRVAGVVAAGSELFAEVALEDDGAGEVSGMGIHPALLDAALHAGLIGAAGGGEDSGVVLPFCWQQVSLHAAGAECGAGGGYPRGGVGGRWSLADGSGRPVLSVGSLLTRPVSWRSLYGRGAVGWAPEALLEVVWSAVPESLAGRSIEPVSVVSWDALSQGRGGSAGW